MRGGIRERGISGARAFVERKVRRLRLEEALFLLLFIPSTIVTVWANVSLARAGISSRKVEGGLLRLAIVVLVGFSLFFLERARRPGARPRFLAEAAAFFRTMLPFALCSAVYTNLHDTVRFVNPHDIHAALVAIEEWMFGLQPVVWAERFITPLRTEFFSAFYTNFFLIAPSVAIVLWFSRKRAEAREALLGVTLCFYTGYVLYVIFPAAPPRLYLESLGAFSVNLEGGPITSFQRALLDMLPDHASRAAFPSLHTAVSLVSLYYAWRYARWFFPILFFFVAGLLASTVYLRHHYVVDLIAGAFLVPWTAWATPRLDRWWTRWAGREVDL
ncbi:MAG: phosphatase PAP2 family protein [Candidatus Eisenbacteria bacterium]